MILEGLPRIIKQQRDKDNTVDRNILTNQDELTSLSNISGLYTLPLTNYQSEVALAAIVIVYVIAFTRIQAK